MKKLNIDYSKLLFWVPTSIYLKILFKRKIGKKLDLKNPKTYSEKLQWLKVHDHNPLYNKLVDKYEVKPIVAKIIGDEYIIPTLGVYDDFDDIDFSKLPNQFVIKCTHDSGGIYICTDKKNMNIKEARDKINNSLNRNYYYRRREWPYKDVRPRIIIEKYVVDNKDKELRDYKFFSFNGKVKLMFVASNRQGAGDTYFDFFDNNFKHLDIINGHPCAPKTPHCPKNFKLMIKLAEKLSKDLPHVRVDFYEINGKVFFGEMTFYHWSGMMPYEPEEWDKKIGDMLDLSKIAK